MSRQSRSFIRSTSCRRRERVKECKSVVRRAARNVEEDSRSDSDKGKATERWRRKVTGLKGAYLEEALHDSGTAGIEPPRGASSVLSVTSLDTDVGTRAQGCFSTGGSALACAADGLPSCCSLPCSRRPRP